MEEFDGFVLDDDEFANSAGISKISKAYVRVFEDIENIGKEGAALASSGSSKEVARIITKIAAKASALVEIASLDKKIVGATGKIFNVFGIEDTSDDEIDDAMSEEDLEELLDRIINNCKTISMTDASEAIERAKNIEDDGLSHGDLDEVDW